MVGRVLLVVRRIILLDQHQVLVLMMVMHELLLQRVLADAIAPVAFVLDPLAVLSRVFTRKRGR